MDIVLETIQIPKISLPWLVSIVWTSLALLGGALGYFYAPYRGVRKVPGPPTVPFLGHLHLFAKHGVDLFPIMANRYGPIFRFHIGRQPLVMIASPELCQEVGIKKFKDITNRSIPSAIASSPLHKKGLTFSRDPRWTRTRNVLLPYFHSSRLAKLVPDMQAHIETAAENIESNKGDYFNFSELSLKMTTDVIGQSSFGVDFGLLKRKSSHNNIKNEDEMLNFIKQHVYATTVLKLDLTGSFSTIVGHIFPILLQPLRQILIRIPGTMDWKIEKNNNTLSAQLDAITAKRMEKPERDESNILSLLVKARDSEATSKLFTSDYVSALTFEQLLAGTSSTAFAISCAIHLISQHPEVEKKLIEEIDGFGPHDKLPTAEDLQTYFPYLDQVLKETMRFFFASPINARITTNDVEIGGYLLPKGTWVWLAPGVLARDPKNFPEPEKFKPERFDPKGDEEKQRHPYAFLPFGLGPRSCIGQKLALQESKLSIIHLYRKFVFRHSPNMESPLEFEYGITLTFKHGVKLKAIKRE